MRAADGAERWLRCLTHIGSGGFLGVVRNGLTLLDVRVSPNIFLEDWKDKSEQCDLFSYI